MRFADTDSSNYVGFKAPGTVSANKIWTLPATDGTSGQLLSTNGSGVLSWVNDATGGGGGVSANYIHIGLTYSSLTAVGGTGKDWRIGASELLDTGNLISISGNQFTLAAGTYVAVNSGAVVCTNASFIRLKLYNVTDSANVTEWAAYNMLTTGTRAIIAIATKVFTLASTKTLEFRHFNDSSSSSIADYTDNAVTIIKVA
jgi:hypothetical protein